MNIQKGAAAWRSALTDYFNKVDRLGASRAVNARLWSVCTPQTRAVQDTEGLSPNGRFPYAPPPLPGSGQPPFMQQRPSAAPAGRIPARRCDPEGAVVYFITHRRTNARLVCLTDTRPSTRLCPAAVPPRAQEGERKLFLFLYLFLCREKFRAFSPDLSAPFPRIFR